MALNVDAAGAMTAAIVAAGDGILWNDVSAAGTTASTKKMTPAEFQAWVVAMALTWTGKATFSAGAAITPASTPATTEVGYLGSPVLTTLDSGNVAPALADCGKTFYHTDGNARNFTIPANGSVAFPLGTVLCLVNENGGANVSIIITTDTLRWGSSTGTRTLAANGTATLIKVASTVWRLTGDGIT